jgi:predicted nuclease of predicted toxin-antitoxin system
VKILLDENLPRKLLATLRAEGHEVESVQTLRFQGLDNGRLFQFACQTFDLCFTLDAGFVNNIRASATPARLKLIRVTIPQKPQAEFVVDFLAVFRATDFDKLRTGDEWPHGQEVK